MAYPVQHTSSMHLLSKRTFKMLAATLGLASLAVAGVACEAEVPGESGGDNPNAGIRKQFNDEVLPLMNSVCGTCHAAGGINAEFQGFMVETTKEPTIFDAVMEWPALVNKNEPGDSRLITKGAHTGRAWTEDELTVIRPWLDEVNTFFGGGSDNEIETTAITPVNGPNGLDLGELGIEGGAGNILHFNYSYSAPLVYLNSFEIEAGPNGVTLDTPYVGVQTSNNKVHWDPNNKFQGVVADVAPNDRQCIGACSLIASWVPADQLAAGPIKLVFGLKGFLPTGAGTAGMDPVGCKDVPFFFANTIPALTPVCNGCHGPNGNRTPWLSRSNATEEAEMAQQCNDVLIRSNIADTAVQHLLIATPTGGNHPGVDVTGIEAALDAFVANEVAAE